MSNKQNRVKVSLVHSSLKPTLRAMTWYCYFYFRDQKLEIGRDSQAQRSWDEAIPLNARFKENRCTTELNRSRYPHLLVLPIMLCIQHSRASLAHIFKLFHIPHTNQLQSPKNPMVRPGGKSSTALR